MSIDTPARIAILGGGPLGLEAALYARFLGYDIALYEKGILCDRLNRWAEVEMFTPFSLNASSLGLAALKAHDPSYTPPSDDAALTAGEFYVRYLLPLSQTDLIVDHLNFEAQVQSILMVPTEFDETVTRAAGDAENGESTPSASKFTLRLVGQATTVDTPFDAVIDATGSEWRWASAKPSTTETDDRPINLQTVHAVKRSENRHQLLFQERPDGLETSEFVAAERRLKSEITVECETGTPSEPVVCVPNYFVIGNGPVNSRNQAGIEIRDGHCQIRDVFAEIVGRKELDLYRQFSQTDT